MVHSTILDIFKSSTKRTVNVDLLLCRCITQMSATVTFLFINSVGQKTYFSNYKSFNFTFENTLEFVPPLPKHETDWTQLI